jgi:hypothetical protein
VKGEATEKVGRAKRVWRKERGRQRPTGKEGEEIEEAGKPEAEVTRRRKMKERQTGKEAKAVEEKESQKEFWWRRKEKGKSNMEGRRGRWARDCLEEGNRKGEAVEEAGRPLWVRRKKRAMQMREEGEAVEEAERPVWFRRKKRGRQMGKEGEATEEAGKPEGVRRKKKER